jgi:hypothetical protein
MEKEYGLRDPYLSYTHYILVYILRWLRAIGIKRLFYVTWDIETANLYYQFEDLWLIKFSRVKIGMNV